LSFWLLFIDEPKKKERERFGNGEGGHVYKSFVLHKKDVTHEQPNNETKISKKKRNRKEIEPENIF
jgi:hypothetical protein